MAYTQPYSAYKATGIKTASKGKLIVMLYEGAMRHMHSALVLFDSHKKLPVKNIEKFHNHIVKTQEIITELMVSLNMSDGGDIAQNLMSLYRFFNRELMDISMSHDFVKLTSVNKLVTELCESWRIAIESPVMSEGHVSLNVEG